MGWRFRRSFKIAPGVRWNIGKKGSSFSFGGKGATINVGKKGTRTTIGIPGTGISHTSYSKKGESKSSGCGCMTLITGAIIIGGLGILVSFIQQIPKPEPAAPSLSTPTPVTVSTPTPPVKQPTPVSHATATPMPTATPVSISSPPPRVIAEGHAPPSNYVPSKVKLTGKVTFPIYDATGAPIGLAAAPIGTTVKLISIKGKEVVVDKDGVRQTIPADSTDLLEQRLGNVKD